VKDIGVSPNTNSLLISWSHGSGHVEQYRLMLMDKGILVRDSVVDKSNTSYAFHGLIPGHLYNLTIMTMAAGLQNYQWKLVRTGEFLLSS
jgi:cadherin 5 type 2 (VE-cadherin)